MLIQNRFTKAVLVASWCAAGLVDAAVGQISIFPDEWPKPWSWSVETRGRPDTASGPYVMFGPKRDDGSLLVVRFAGGHASITIEYHNGAITQVDAPASLTNPSHLPPRMNDVGDSLKVAYEISKPSTWGSSGGGHTEFFKALHLWMGRRQADVGRIAMRDDLLVMLGPALTGPGAPIGLHRAWVDREPQHLTDAKRLTIECVGSNILTMQHLKPAIEMAQGDNAVLGLGEDADDGWVLVARQVGLSLKTITGSAAMRTLGWRADDAILGRLKAPGVAGKLEGGFVATDSTSVLRIKALSAQGRRIMAPYFLGHPRLYSVAIP